MGVFLGWLSGLGGIGLCLVAVASLLVPIAPPPLRPVLATAALGGLVAGWALRSLRAPSGAWAAAVFLGLAVVPLAAGPATAEGLRQAWELFRFAVPPVPAAPALIGITAAMMWLLGMGVAASATAGRIGTAALPPLAVATYLFVLDRSPTPWWAITALALLLGVGLLADRPLRRTDALPTAGYVLAASSMGLALTLAFGSLVPLGGIADWRNSTGSGAGIGSGASFDLFVGMHRDLLESSTEPVFVATTDASGAFYWNLITLENYDGTRWSPGNLAIGPPDQTWEDPRMSPYGPTRTVGQVVRILGLRQSLLPHLYSPTEVSSDDQVLLATLRKRQDGSLLLAARTSTDLTYRVESRIPASTLADLATAAGLPPIFSQAAAAGRFSPSTQPGGSRQLPGSLHDIYTRLPAQLPDQIVRLAEGVAAGVETDLEKAILLETFLRDPANRFEYDLSVQGGHDSPTMAAWLTDPSSPFYRKGYCEQFAAAMAVMARAVGVPARVVLGFAPGREIAPGTVEVQRRQGHAWVEIWLTGGGWTRFDPTPRADGPGATSSQLDFDPREFLPPGTSAEIPVIGEAGELEQPTPERGSTTPPEEQSIGGFSVDLGPILLGLLVVSALAATIPAVKWSRGRMRRRRWRQGDSAAAWRELSDRLADLGHSRHKSQTMVEFAAALDPAYAAVAHRAGAGFYGGKKSSGLASSMERAEAKLRQSHTARRRLLAWLSLRSMRPDSGRTPASPR